MKNLYRLAFFQSRKINVVAILLSLFLGAFMGTMMIQLAPEKEWDSPSVQAEEPVLLAKRLDISEDNRPERFNLAHSVIGELFDSIVTFNNDSYNHYGISTFRGGSYRDNAFYGMADILEKKLELQWVNTIGGIDKWTGTGWTGQPAIVKWRKQEKEAMNLFPEFKNKDNFKEVIYATLDGNIYFYDLDTGKPTRENTIKLPASVKGTVTIDPRGFPILYVGQGIAFNGEKRVETGYRIYSLIDQSLLYFIDGRDGDAYRSWSAFDASALIDPQTDTLIEAGENGIVYLAKLKTYYDGRAVSVSPETHKYKYFSNLNTNDRIGTENSVATYRDLMYFADNAGLLQCVDINTLEPVWAANVTDDTDSTIALDPESEEFVGLYTGNEVDSQGAGGKAYVRKFNALNGKLIWEKEYPCVYDSHVNGGVLGSPIVGKNNLSGLVVFNIAKTNSSFAGKLVAYDKRNGDVVWEYAMANYSWSSPVAVYDKQGMGYIVICDSSGNIKLLDGKNGEELYNLHTGHDNIESSPAIYDDMIVVGTRWQKIIAVKIK